MAKKKKEHMVTALDIGTSKIVALVGKVDPDSKYVEVVGCGSSLSRGLKRGVVVNIEATVAAISRAVDDANLMSGYDIKEVWAGIAGEHIRGEASNGTATVQKSGKVSEADMHRACQASIKGQGQENQRILHNVPQSYSIDSMHGVKQPCGMLGGRLEVFTYVVSCANNAYRNLEHCIDLGRIKMHGLVLESLASSYAVLHDDEKELGVNLIDIGCGTTDIASFIDGSLCHIDSIRFGGQKATLDIANTYRIPTACAEHLKTRHGHVIPAQAGDELLTVDGLPGGEVGTITRRLLAEAIGAFYEELFVDIRDRIHKVKGQLPGSSIVLTGGGALVEGVRTLAEDIFESSVRIGLPHDIAGLSDEQESPIYATAVGLLKYAMHREQSFGVRDGDFWDRFQHGLQRMFGRNSSYRHLGGQELA